jgi:hypothetical protein
MPAHKIGVVVLLNSVASTFADIVMTYAYDRLRGESGIDAAYDKRIRAYEEVLSRARATAAGQRRRRAELASRSTTQVDYEGVYENPLFGRINVMHLDGVRWAVIGAARSVMHPRERPHEFDVDLDGATAPLRFEVAAAGGTPQRLSFRDNDFARVER